MASHRLLTEELRKRLPVLFSMDPVPVAEGVALTRYFAPWSDTQWYPVEFDGEDLFFGLVAKVSSNVFDYDFFRLSELEGIRGPGGHRIQRDPYFKATPLVRLDSSLKSDASAERDAAGSREDHGPNKEDLDEALEAEEEEDRSARPVGDDAKRNGPTTYRVHLLYRFWVDVEAHDEIEAHELAEDAPIDWDESELVAEFVNGLSSIELDGIVESLRVQRDAHGFPLDEREVEVFESLEEEEERSR